MRALLLLFVAAVCGAGVLLFGDRWGDGPAYAAAQHYLVAGPEIREIFGDSAVAERTAGSVMGDQVVNWIGVVHGRGREARARVGMKRLRKEGEWQGVRATFQFLGDDVWQPAYPPPPPPPKPVPVPESIRRAHEALAAFAGDTTDPRDPAGALHHPLIGDIISIAQGVGAEEALAFADSAAGVIGDSIFGIYGGAMGLFQGGYRADAVTRVRMWTVTSPDNAAAWTALANIQALGMAWPYAREAATRAIELDSTSVDAWHLRSMAFVNAHELDWALLDARRACELGHISSCYIARDIEDSLNRRRRQ